MRYIKKFLIQFSKAMIIGNVKAFLIIGGAIMAIIFFLAAIILLFGGKYLPGRDTVESFGNGRFQILRSPVMDDNDTEIHSLYDEKESIWIEKDIYNSYDEKTTNRLYVIGVNGYTILDYKKEEYKQEKDFMKFNEEEMTIFEQMKNME